MVEKVDCHGHVLNGGIGDVAEMNRCQREEYGYCATNFLSVECMDDCAQNAMAIYFKLLHPDNYAFGGLHYRFSYDFGHEVRQLWELGLDGMKMVENKPSERKRLGYAQDDARYDCFYDALEALDFPVLIHVNDPRENWDWERCSQWGKEHGYYYGDGSFVSFDQVLEETISMLEHHPKLRVCMAHLFFLSDDGAYLSKLMDRFPNLWLDITAGTEMYYAFDKNPAFWRQFFLRYQDRILFGTDNCYPADEYDRKIAREINQLELDFLHRSDRFPLWDGSIQGAGLPPSVCCKITGENFRRFAGQRPRSINKEKAAAYLQSRLNEPRFSLSSAERQIITTVIQALKT